MALIQEINKLKKAKLTHLRFSLYSINRQIDLLTINLDRKCQIVAIIVDYLIFFSTQAETLEDGQIKTLFSMVTHKEDIDSSSWAKHAVVAVFLLRYDKA